MIIYLAGGIHGLNDSDAKDWRQAAKDTLQHETLDPMRRDYRGREDESVTDIVHGDLDDIDACDVVLAMCTRPSWGTAMEVHYATGVAGISVHAVVSEGPVSPWLRYFTVRIYRSLGEAVSVLNRFEVGGA